MSGSDQRASRAPKHSEETGLLSISDLGLTAKPAPPRPRPKPPRPRPPRPPEPPPSSPLQDLEVILEESETSVMITGISPDAVPRPAPPPPAKRPPKPPPKRPPPQRRSVPPPKRENAKPPPYDDQGMIARGGMGRIHAVIDKSLQRQVAMKLFDPLDKSDPTTLDRFVEEAQLTSRLDHPNIVPVHALGALGEGPSFFTMKLIRGQDLKQVLETLGRDRLRGRNLEHLVDVIVRCCNALSFAHSHGVLHRDLKPTNVMVGGHGQVYVMDWGLAYVQPKDGSVPAQEYRNAIGTPAYMAPEQAWPQPERLGAQTDVFGLGGLLYAILTGGPPHQAKTPIESVLKARACEVAHPQSVVDERLPPELCRITMKALSAAPEDRHESVTDFRHDLEQFLRGGGWLETRTLAPGDVIVREGDEAHEAYIVIDGDCDVLKEINGTPTVVKTMSAGEVFGESVFLSGGRRQATVVAKTEVFLKVVTRESLESELSGKGWLRLFITTLAERFGELSSELTSLRR